MTRNIAWGLIKVQTINFKILQILGIITEIQSIEKRFFNLIYPLFTNFMYKSKEKVDQNRLVQRWVVLNIIF